MFGLFKKKSQVEVLRSKYQKLMEESFVLSKSNRAASDKKIAEAELVMIEIELLSK
ncbi:MAG: Lacal_2735 family protein [Polaribacter sp.]|nr:Lacal_2735 family protein [Polaribacter sp.]MDG1811562.1 Lacal_2735 family protein [Polaribacter sp.]MDG1994786.1 Lacal_2735 family protein [Polaribacter sp.]